LGRAIVGLRPARFQKAKEGETKKSALDGALTVLFWGAHRHPSRRAKIVEINSPARPPKLLVLPTVHPTPAPPANLPICTKSRAWGPGRGRTPGRTGTNWGNRDEGDGGRKGTDYDRGYRPTGTFPDLSVTSRKLIHPPEYGRFCRPPSLFDHLFAAKPLTSHAERCCYSSHPGWTKNDIPSQISCTQRTFAFNPLFVFF